MVKIIDYALRESRDGRKFVSLQLEGDPEFIQSMETGRFYLTAKHCSVTSTFNEETAKSLIGTSMPGTIVRSECESYDYMIPETGEVIKLAHTYEYRPEQPRIEHPAIAAIKERMKRGSIVD